MPIRSLEALSPASLTRVPGHHVRPQQEGRGPGWRNKEMNIASAGKIVVAASIVKILCSISLARKLILIDD